MGRLLFIGGRKDIIALTCNVTEEYRDLPRQKVGESEVEESEVELFFADFNKENFVDIDEDSFLHLKSHEIGQICGSTEGKKQLLNHLLFWGSCTETTSLFSTGKIWLKYTCST